MAKRLKPLNEQVVVIAGASSGIGLTTARMAAARGAKVVLASRNETALAQVAQQIRAAGGEAAYEAADVSNPDDVRRVADAAISAFGTIDTWVNVAAVAIYGRAEQVSLEDSRRLFDVNFWGQVHGSLTAMKHLKQHGGALINVGSTESDRALPLHSMYSASKHAIKGFTEALRMELEEEGAPVSVTLIKPGSIDTPFTEHARNYMGRQPTYPPPVYAPEVVAKAILYAAVHPERDIFAGGGGKMISVSGRVAPRLTDLFMERTMFKQQQLDEPPRNVEGNLYEPAHDEPRERGDYPGHVMEHSLYTAVSLHPWVAGMLLGAAGLAVAGLATGGASRKRDGWMPAARR